MSARPVDLPALLLAVERASPAEAVDTLATELAAALGATQLSFLIADYSGRQLVRLAGSGGRDVAGARQQVPIATTIHGRVLRSQQVEVELGETAAWLVAPVTNRGEALGVLEMTVPSPPDAEVVAAAGVAAHALAYVVIANRRFTDLFEWGQRSVPADLSAEIQRRSLPGSYTCEAARFSLAGWLESAPRIAGDSFDYCLDHDHLYVSITDAMGHAVAAAQLATLAVGSLRNSRRRDAGVAEMAERANRAVAEHGRGHEFVAGLLVQVDLSSGAARVVNACHPAPYRVRDGRVERLHFPADLPFGVFAESSYHIHLLDLRPGDRLVLVSDGMLERNAADADLAEMLRARLGLHPREVVQELSHGVTEASNGRLSDDATVVCLDWYGGDVTTRNVGSGADIDRASPPSPR